MKYILLLLFLIPVTSIASNSIAEAASKQETSGQSKITGTLKLHDLDDGNYDQVEIFVKGTNIKVKGKNDKTFEITGLDSLEYNLVFIHPFYDTIPYPVDLSNTDSLNIGEIDFVPHMKKSYVNVKVNLQNQVEGYGSYNEVVLKSDGVALNYGAPDDSGNFNNIEIERGPQTISAELENYVSDSEVLTNVTPGQTRSIDLSLKFKNGFIEGETRLDTIFDFDKTASNQNIQLYLSGEEVDGNIDENGNFLIEHIPPGTYTLKAEHEHYSSVIVKNIKIEENGKLDTFKIEDPMILDYDYGTLNVTIRDFFNGNKILAGAQIEIRGELSNTTILDTLKDGTEVYNSLFQEPVDVYVRKDGYVAWHQEIDVTGETKNVDVDLYILPDVSLTPDTTVYFSIPLIKDSVGTEIKTIEVNAQYLTESLLITASEHFQISEDGQNFYTELIKDAKSNEVRTTIFVRFAPSSEGNPLTGTITATTTYGEESTEVSDQITVSGIGLEEITFTISKTDGSGDQVCKGESINLTANPSGGGAASETDYEYSWTDKVTGKSSDTTIFESGIVDEDGYEITLTITDTLGNEKTETFIAGIYDIPSGNVIIKGEESKILLYTPEAGYSYEWFRDNTSLGNLQYYYPGDGKGWESGDYYVEITDDLHGCYPVTSQVITEDELKAALLEFALQQKNNQTNNFLVYPNPASDHVKIYNSVAEDAEISRISIFNLKGEIIYDRANFQNTSISPLEINLNGQTSGVYFIRVSMDGQSETQKLIIK